MSVDLEIPVSSVTCLYEFKTVPGSVHWYKTEGRKEFNKILSVVKTGGTVIFDSVSRTGRNIDECIQFYMELFDKGVNLVFLKEGYSTKVTIKKSLETKKLILEYNKNFHGILIRNSYYKYKRELFEKLTL